MEAGKPMPSASQMTGENDEDGLTSDTVHLIQILPPEIWRLVANKLQSRSNDGVANLANSSAFFQNLLASQRTTYLFEKVFPLVVQSIWKKEGLEGFPVSDVLRCRGVSKHWNTVIDKLVPEKLQYFGEDSNDEEDDEIGDTFECLVSANEFDNFTLLSHGYSRSVEKFLRHFERTHPGGDQESGTKTRNPWIWGHISVNVFSRNRQNFVEEISTLLFKYGVHLESFAVQIDLFEFFAKPTLLQEWLSLMPNLKKFRFEFWASRFQENNIDMDLEEAIEEMPFPPLRSLEGVCIVNLPLPLFNNLVEQNNHVVEFHCEDLYNIGYDILAFDLPNLKSLKVSDYSDDLVELLGSPQVNWRLETLKLLFRTADPVNAMALFQVIQTKFENTLVSLKLDVNGQPQDKVQLWQDCKNCRLDLPKLRQIWISLKRNPVCLDFLLPMEDNLEEISANFDYELGNFPGEGMETSGNIVQYFGFEGKMFESNIWGIFKKMMKFEVRGNSGTKKYYRHDKP